MIFHKPPRARGARYRISADRTGLRLDVDEDFWIDAQTDTPGTTTFDRNVEQVVEEVRAALYFCGVCAPRA